MDDGRGRPMGERCMVYPKKGCDVIATDIVDARLQEASKQGFIKKYKKENAESLSFKDESFDYVLCKESYHHFPRPMIALYEMLRVSSKAVVLIEPADRYMTSNILDILFKVIINNIFHIETRHQFEKVAKNYVYTISEREIEKAALGMNYPVIACKGFNWSSLKAGQQETYSKNSKIYKKFKRKMLLLNLLAWLKFRKRGKLVSVIFKIPPPASLLANLKRNGFNVNHLPNNSSLHL